MKEIARPAGLRRKTRALEPQAETEIDFFWRFLRFAFLHFILGFLLYQFRPILPTIFALGVILVGLSALAGKDPARLAFVIVYIAGAELAWRMTEARVFWELGKYLTVALVLLGLLRWRWRLSSLAIVYFALLIPAIFLTLSQFPPSLARDAISFNLSGPLALTAAAIFFQNLHLNRQQVGRMLLVGILPVISVSALVLRRLGASVQITFDLNSNFITSGGYGPNQVSAILGLGALLGFLYLFWARPKGVQQSFTLGLIGLLVAQSALTFSRGGLYNLLLVVPLALFFFMRQGGEYQRRVFLFVLVVMVLFGVLGSTLNDFTSGMLLKRFQDTNTTGRVDLISADLRIWFENPIWGVGVGVSSLSHAMFFNGVDIASHTEYSRVLAEHGSLGLVALFILALMVIRTFLRARTNLARGLVLALMFWSLAEMTHAAMRIAAISIIFAIPLAQLDFTDDEARLS
jgi:hypothetical protein